MNECDEFRLLKQEYESALREEALYEYGGAASLRQAIRYGSAAVAVTLGTPWAEAEAMRSLEPWVSDQRTKNAPILLGPGLCANR
jgi:hypothetical protein